VESEGDEGLEAAGFVLQFPKLAQMIGAVP